MKFFKSFFCSKEKFLILFFLLCACLKAESILKQNIEPLMGFKDSGLYCNFNSFQPGYTNKGSVNLLSTNKAASSESPWTFYIMQYHAPEKKRADYDVSLIKKMYDAGKKVILRAGIGARAIDASLDLDLAEKRLINMLHEVNPKWLYAITLDEENVYWNGRAKVLAELYRRIKKLYPNLRIYQWWTPMVAPNVNAKSGWVALPADGWVFDLYGLSEERYEKQVLKFKETGKELIGIIWASPKWAFYEREYEGPDWWKTHGRKIFDTQLKICRSYDIPVAFFCTQKKEIDPVTKKKLPIRWGWMATDPDIRNWYLELEGIAEGFKYIPDQSIGYRTASEKAFKWAHTPQEPTVRIDIDENGNKRYCWRICLDDLVPTEGKLDLTQVPQNPYWNLVCDDIEKEYFKTDGLGLSGVAGRVNRKFLTFKIIPNVEISSPSITVGARVIRLLGGKLSLSILMDNGKWSKLIKDSATQKKHKIEITESWQKNKKFTKQIFKFKVELACLAKEKTKTCVSVNWIEITACVKK